MKKLAPRYIKNDIKMILHASYYLLLKKILTLDEIWHFSLQKKVSTTCGRTPGHPDGHWILHAFLIIS